MSRVSILFLFCLGTLASLAQSIGVYPAQMSAIGVDVPKSTGIDKVYVVWQVQGTRLEWPVEVAWKRFGPSGPVHAVDAGFGKSLTLSQSGDAGYLVEQNGRSYIVWLVDYSVHAPSPEASMTVSGESSCDHTVLDISGGFDHITYPSSTGAPQTLDRGIAIEYDDLTWNAESEQWANAKSVLSKAWVNGTTGVAAPLCNTRFILKGDRFLKDWGEELTLQTDVYNAVRVEAHTVVAQTQRDNDNESNPSGATLGGSAPCEVSFKAFPTDAAVFKEWQFSKTPDFDVIDDRYNQEEFEYTFTDYGTTYARFVCADASGDCTWEGETYTIAVGESKLECPNAFSPLNEDGVNDIWKVSYSSIVDFDCHIFNRWGTQITSFTNPADGWDGKYGGKFVKPGVYFYVITARGADGKKYKLSGDINIVGSRLIPRNETD